MPTTAERHAIAFLVAVATLGTGVRLLQAHQASQALQSLLRDPVRDSVIVGDTRARLALSLQQQRADSAHRATPPKVNKLKQGDAPIAVNSASVLELQRLPRVGPALAARIVASRDTAGPFTSLQDLTRVRGIGPAMTQKLAPFVVFSSYGR